MSQPKKKASQISRLTFLIFTVILPQITRFFMLLSPIQRVEVLCNMADVVGWIKPNTPAPISPALNPTIKR